MNWAQKQRIDFIQERLLKSGHVNRRELMEKFGISIATASADIRTFRGFYPKAARYNLSTKRYEAI